MSTSVAALAAALGALLVLTSSTSRRAARSPGVPDISDDATRWRLPSTHRARRRRSTTVTPIALARWADDVARSLRHGATLRAALRSVSPADPALARHVDELWHLLDRGATVSHACTTWPLERGGAPRHELVATLAAVLSATATIGGSAAAPLDRFAAAMRQRGSEDLERRAHSAQATMSAHVLTVTPVAVLALLLATDDDVRTVVVEPAGALVVGAGLFFNVAGWFWMHRIVGHHGRTGAS